MKLIHWNISYNSRKEKVGEYLTRVLQDADTIACLQEVQVPVFEYLRETLGYSFDYVYSLFYRRPGKYDGKNRKLGVMIICPKTM